MKEMKLPILATSSRNDLDQIDNDNNEYHVEDIFGPNDQACPSHRNDTGICMFITDLHYPVLENSNLSCPTQ